MNKKELIKNLRTDIQDTYSIINRFENTENIHPLDIDLALSKVRNLYELLLKLNPQGSYFIENQEKEISTPVKKNKNPVPEETITPPAKTEKNQQEIKPAEQQKEQDTPAKKVDEQPESDTEYIKESDEKTASNSKVSNDADYSEPDISSVNPEIVADKFQSKRFVHDDISRKNTKKDVSSKMQSKPIQDINSAIGLNDKFIFIRELFDNDKEQYLETIQVLNNFDTYENAVAFLNENFDWDAEDPNFERLKELVRRKYAAK